MAITEADIQRLEAELVGEFEAAQQKAAEAQRQLAALELLKDRLHNLSAAAAATESLSFEIGNAPPSINNGSGRDLRGVVLAVLHDAKVSHETLRPTQIVERCSQKGYQFNSHRGAMGSVTKVLTRLYRRALVVKYPDGTYTGR